MKHKLTMKFTKREQGLEWKYNSKLTKYIGLDIADKVKERFRDGRMSIEEYTSFKLTCTFESDSDESV